VGQEREKERENHAHGAWAKAACPGFSTHPSPLTLREGSSQSPFGRLVFPYPWGGFAPYIVFGFELPFPFCLGSKVGENGWESEFWPNFDSMV
jgi:hypothetical protein